MDVIINFILEIASIPVYIAVVLALLAYKHLDKELRIFTYFIFLSGIIEAVSTFLWYQRVNNFPLLHLYVAGGFLLQIWFYREILKKFINVKVIYVTGALFLLFSLLNSIFFESIYNFNSNALTVQCVLIITLSISTYMLFLNDIVKRETNLTSIKSLNWINSGLFLYYSSSLLIFYFGKLFTENYPVNLNQYTWVIHTVFLFIMYACFIVGITINWRARRYV